MSTEDKCGGTMNTSNKAESCGLSGLEARAIYDQWREIPFQSSHSWNGIARRCKLPEKKVSKYLRANVFRWRQMLSAKRERRVLEADVESAFVKLCPWWTIKLNGSGARGNPDRMILLPDGCACFVEFKAPGAAPTRLQYHQLNRLRELGYPAYWFDDAAEALAWLHAWHKALTKKVTRR